MTVASTDRQHRRHPGEREGVERQFQEARAELVVAARERHLEQDPARQQEADQRSV
ncbi:MAG: hypothetical protein U5L06_13665 [Rhodovibrio sp.]|nr:hypothetical protein [Rhodovibrio sp.]